MARKIPEGEFRNKEKTKLKLINAVGEIIRTEGYTKLGVNNIANKADVSKKLIYRYFETAENLIETYVRGKDYWLTFNTAVDKMVAEHQVNFGKDLAVSILENFFHHLQTVPEMQKVILWEISEKNTLMQEVSAVRERFGSDLFKMTDPLFDGTDVDLRAVYALLLGGIYYLTLHSNASGGGFCEINMETVEGKNRIIKAFKYIASHVFEEAENQQKKKK